LTQPVSFEIKKVSVLNGYQNCIIVLVFPSRLSYPYIQNIYYSKDEGQSWNISRVDDIASNNTDLEQFANRVFNTAYTYDISYSVIAGNRGYLFYTVNGGVTWYQYGTALSEDILSIYMNSSYIYFITSTRLYYFQNQFPSPASYTNSRNIIISQVTDLSSVSLTNSTSIHGNASNVYIATSSGYIYYKNGLSPLSVHYN